MGMKIGLVSDTHDNTRNTAAALEVLRGEGVELVVHCGDICRPATVALFAGLPTHFVWGNNDSNKAALRLAMQAAGATSHEPFGHLELAGKQIAWAHGDDWGLVRELLASDAFDYFFYGHTHMAKEHVEGRTRVINPGALHRARVKTCAVLDVVSGELRRFEV
jgi:putative phosphoesterase